MTDIAILGSGAFGTALAIVLGSEGPVRLWARRPEAAEAIAATRRNPRLEGAVLPEAVEVTSDLSAAATAGTVLLAVPTQSLAAVVGAIGDHRGALVACCKGVDLQSGRGPSGVIAAGAPGALPALLTGPSFAADIAAGLPTALTLACADAAGGAELQHLLATPVLRLYLAEDVVGAELGGALKNVVALAAGMAIGAGFGESARAAIVTRGFAEMSRFATAAGARPETLAGLSGLGDLTLTASSEKSRNYATGIDLGRGRPLPQDRTVEGVATARAVVRLAEERGIDMPLTRTVARVTAGDLTVAEAAGELLARPLKAE
jgi:glycerol-3-phosphate dehydrogenase (NAD(P)+)